MELVKAGEGRREVMIQSPKPVTPLSKTLKQYRSSESVEGYGTCKTPPPLLSESCLNSPSFSYSLFILSSLSSLIPSILH